MRRTQTLIRLLLILAENPDSRHYGYELMKKARLASGTLYPILRGLEVRNLVTSDWETPNGEIDRPRKYYMLTAEGAQLACKEAAVASVMVNEKETAKKADPRYVWRTAVPGV